MEHVRVQRRLRAPDVDRPADAAHPQRAEPWQAAVLAMQRLAGNRATASLLTPATVMVQRQEALDEDDEGLGAGGGEEAYAEAEPGGAPEDARAGSDGSEWTTGGTMGGPIEATGEGGSTDDSNGGPTTGEGAPKLAAAWSASVMGPSEAAREAVSRPDPDLAAARAHEQEAFSAGAPIVGQLREKGSRAAYPAGVAGTQLYGAYNMLGAALDRPGHEEIEQVVDSADSRAMRAESSIETWERDPY